MSLDSVQLSAQSRTESSPPRAVPPLIRRLGMASLALAILAVALEVLAIAIGSGGAWGAATVLAWFVIGLLAVSFVLGLVAILTGRGRRWGIGAVVLSLLGNPLVLVWLFSLFRGFS